MTKNFLADNIVYEYGRDLQVDIVASRTDLLNPCENYHFHKRIEIIFTVKGRVTVDTEFFHSSVVNEGEIFIVEENVLHRINSCEKGDYFLLLLPDNFTGALTKLRDGDNLKGCIAKDSENGILFSLLSEIINCGSVKNAPKATEFYLRRLIDALLSRIFLFMGSCEKRESDFSDIKYIIDYILKNIETPFSIKELSRKFGFSPNALSTMFSKSYGIGFKEYIMKMRIAVVKRLLCEGHSINEAYERGGFNCYRSFHRAFIKLEGITPGKYKSSLSKLSN